MYGGEEDFDDGSVPATVTVDGPVGVAGEGAEPAVEPGVEPQDPPPAGDEPHR
jgi:hypothetical protein